MMHVQVILRGKLAILQCACRWNFMVKKRKGCLTPFGSYLVLHEYSRSPTACFAFQQ